MSKIFAEWYKYRALYFALVRRHLASRYRGSMLGFLWTFLNPLCLISVYWLVFKFYIRFTQVENYTVFMFCGLLPWMWTTQSLLEGTASISGSGHLITKSLFPAHLLPTVAISSALVNFVLSLPILLGLMLVTDVPLNWTLLLLPIVISFHFFLLLGIVLCLSALNVYYRDIQHVLGNMLTLLFFLCPIVYSSDVVPPKFQWTLVYNPLAALIQVYHRIIMEGVFPESKLLLSIAFFSIAAMLIGSVVYNRCRENFAELL